MANKIIFIVDDDSSAREGLGRLIRTAGHDVREFAAIHDFLEAIVPGVSGCLILDAGMPDVLSEEIRAGLQACRTNLPVIVVTAADSPEVSRKAEELNAAGFFHKPIDGPALLDSVAWLMRPGTGNSN